MKRNTLIRTYTAWVLVAVFLVISGAWQAEAVITGPTDITIKHACISMPDGAVTAPAGTTCPAGTIKMWLPADSNGLLAPGSFVIRADEDDDLTINLRNELAIPVSLVIPGQVLSNNTGPVWFADIANPYTSTTVTGSRPGVDVTSRVRSFSHETPAGAPGTPGAARAYTWNDLKPGTYLIMSGTHPSLQVQMGIYGVLIVRAGGGAPYAGIPNPAQEATLLFSEIDPAIHNSANDAAMVATPPTIPSTNVFFPKYFLINGKAFPGNNPIPIGAAGSTTLLRFANAGLDTYVPLLQGQSMQVIAEDGHLKAADLRFNRYSVDLHAGKTFDALLTNPAVGYIPVYDRRLYLSNAAKAPGGMLAYLQVGSTNPTLTVATNGGTGTGKVVAESLPGGIHCNSSVPGSDCTQDYLAGIEVKLVGYPTTASSLGWTGCDSLTAANECLVTMNTAKNVTAAFGGGPVGGGITLTSPNGGEVWQRGQTQTITWNFAGTPGTHVRIQAMKGTRLVNVVFRTPIGANGSGSFNWRIPRFFGLTGNDIKLKITVTTNATITDTSDNFFTLNR
jgi:hypothetical protein